MHLVVFVYTALYLAVAGTLLSKEFRPSTPPYDFLAFVDEDHPHKEPINISDQVAYANEHGVGL